MEQENGIDVTNEKCIREEIDRNRRGEREEGDSQAVKAIEEV